MNRVKWFKIHSWAGVHLSIFLCFILITGTLATISYEIDWIANDAMRVSPSSVTEMNWSKVYMSARSIAPENRLSRITRPLEPWFAAEITAYSDNKKLYRMFFHPSTGKYLGDGRWYNWQRFFRMSHRHLMLPVKYGVPIVSICAFLLLTSLITSFVVYRNWWKHFFRWPRTQHRKMLWGDVHRLLGVWNIWFILIIGITGVWYLVEVLGPRASYPSRGQVVTQAAQQQAIMPTVSILELALDTTALEFSDLDITSVQFPSRKNSPLVIQGQASAILVRNRANTITFDPVSGELLTKFRGEQLNSLARIAEAVDPLHFGTFAGLPSRLIYFLFGILLSTLAISGTYIYAMKIARISNKQTFSRKRVWANAHASIRWGKWLSYLAIGTCLVLGAGLFTGLIIA